MITRLQVSNFKSIGPGADVHLGPLTAFVGTNGSGKSNLLDVIAFLADCMKLRLDGALNKRGGISGVRRWSHSHPYDVSVRVELRTGVTSGAYELTLRSSSVSEYVVLREAGAVLLDGSSERFEVREGTWVVKPTGVEPALDPQDLVLPLLGGDRRFRPLAETLRQATVYSIFPNALRLPQKPSAARPMDAHGENWCSVLKEQLDDLRPDLLSALRHLSGDIEDVKVQRVGGFLLPSFRHRYPNQKNPKWLDAGQESDGTLRVAGLVTALRQRPFLHSIGLEEPELTVHPGALELIVDFIREGAANGQVLLTTHSPDLLDLLRDEEVRLVELRAGRTHISAMSDRQRELVRERLYSLGDLLRSGDFQTDLFTSPEA